jgi:hypothetical protein
MKMKLKLDLKPATILPLLKRGQGYLIGGALIGVFAYTAYVVNAAVNVQAAPAAVPAAGVTFDQATLNSLKSLTTVPVTIAPPALGKSDPFGNN